MVTLSALETRLQNRLGFTSLSTLQSAQLREALNAAVGRVLTEGAPGLNRTVIAANLGDYTASNTVSAVAGNDYLDSDASENFVAAGILPGDVVVLNDTRKLLVHRIESGTTTRIYVGSNFDQAYTNATLTVHRRGLVLPTGGRVISLRKTNSDREVEYSPRAIYRAPFSLGDPRWFSQSKDVEGSDVHYVSIAPVPQTATDYVIVQAYEIGRLTTDSDNFEIPEGVIDVVLTRGVEIYRSLTTNDQVELISADDQSTDADDQLRDRDAASGTFIK